LAYGLFRQLTCSDNQLDSHVVGVADRLLHVCVRSRRCVAKHTVAHRSGQVGNLCRCRGRRSRCGSRSFQSMWMQ
jgi:hypothetical protein